MSKMYAIIRSVRPWQWPKNLLVFAAILFSGRILDPTSLVRASAAFGLFCLLAGSVYLLNDVIDADRDRKHPLKARRPVASGEISRGFALVLFVAIAASSLAGAYSLDRGFFVTAVVYFVLLTAYSLVLKHMVVVDVLVLSLGFLIRAAAGAVVIGVHFSPWLLLCTFFLSLFLALNKRRHEITFLDTDAQEHRAVLAHYSPYLLDQMIAVATASSVLSYALYAMSADTTGRHGSAQLIYTIPFVVYGIFRYLYLVHKKHKGGAPELVIVSDLPLAIDIIAWAALAAYIVKF